MDKFQYNKITMIQFGRDLAVRRNALPVLQNKEAALRAETRRIRQRMQDIEQKIAAAVESLVPLRRLWAEFPDIVRVDTVVYAAKKIASVHVQVVADVLFAVEPFHMFSAPAWFAAGIERLKAVMRLKVELLNEAKVLRRVEYARRKTTQKVNLYEKVQIPFYEESIRKIKRYMEDEDNLSRSAQKVIKKRLEAGSR
ncbi:MAG: V-type ATP synthase subunit D [Candidatus Omnitrophica bacterium]|nr:V-type ATP synthase subunit D [Candidatus Omnitrophota bacterium]